MEMISPISAAEFELMRLIEPAAGCCSPVGGIVLVVPIRLSVRESNLLVGFAVIRPPILVGKVDCSVIELPMREVISELMRFLTLVVGFLLKEGRGDSPVLIEPPMRELKFELMRLFELSAGCLAVYEGGVLVMRLGLF